MSNLMHQFVRSDMHAYLRKKPKNLKQPFARLPFVNWKHAWEIDKGFAWSLPAHGGYFGGYETGRAMAYMLLKHMREHAQPSGQSSNHQITWMVESLMARFEQEGGVQAWQDRAGNDGMPALRGQLIGFFNTLSDWVAASARKFGRGLDDVEMDELIKSANLGLNFDHVAYMESFKVPEHEGDA